MTHLIKTPAVPCSHSSSTKWPQYPGGSQALALLQATRDNKSTSLVITPDLYQAANLTNDLDLLRQSNDPEITRFPDWEILPYDLFSPHPDIISARLKALRQLLNGSNNIIVAAIPTLLQRLPPLSFLSNFTMSLKTGELLDIESFISSLEASGYHQCSQVISPGEYAHRGGIIDIFMSGFSQPIRIEMLDDEIDSLRTFDPETQLTLEKTHSIEFLPAREFPTEPEAISAWRARFRDQFDIDLRKCALYQDMRKDILPGGIEFYLPLFFDQTALLTDYLPKDSLIFWHHDPKTAILNHEQQLNQRFEQRRHDTERPILAPNEIAATQNEWLSACNAFKQIFSLSGDSSQQTKIKPAPDVPLHNTRGESGAALKNLLADNRVVICCDSAGRREYIRETLQEFGFHARLLSDATNLFSPQHSLSLIDLPISDGFILEETKVVLLTEQQLFGARVKVERSSPSIRQRDPESIIKDLTDLQEGSPVVHEDHGIGRYLGLIMMDVGDIKQEFLALQYAGKDKLYVPVSSLHLISRYTGASPDNAPLHKLGGEQWQRIRKKAAEKVHDVAAELLDLYARRAAKGGYGHRVDKHMYLDFASTFPFDETEDQQTSIDAVLSDLEAPCSMDRVVCGDVGFGKTEVALRAAFAVASGGKQVGVLVPTTLLAQQHYRNFADRFADWPIRVEVISRFGTAKQTRDILKETALGKVDVLIGTHRLLQKDIAFRDLGLIIVDEEQRFGVRQKEKLKAMRADVDLLTLTATPIPRTLNLAMAGLRDLSIIATPPQRRVAVKTFVNDWDNTLIKEAMLREFQRGGQVYFLHNEVSTIERMGATLQELMPEARIAIAHGQMGERELEVVMQQFYRQHANVLLCTTIIENGIDIASANTIIINRADKFGLGQLHQLRGRVGRSHHQAYAYMLIPDWRSITSDARKRLEAISSLEDLGAGFTLATHDLEIRGAGEILGEDQSGQIQEVGFSLYMEMLDRAVTAMKSGEDPDLNQPLHHELEVQLHCPALIPDDYLPDIHLRLTLYKRIAGAKNKNDLKQLKIELIDRFGSPPDAANNLFDAARIRMTAQPLGVKYIEFSDTGGRIDFIDKPKIDPNKVIQLMQKYPNKFSMPRPNRLGLRHEIETVHERVLTMLKILQDIQ